MPTACLRRRPTTTGQTPNTKSYSHLQQLTHVFPISYMQNLCFRRVAALCAANRMFPRSPGGRGVQVKGLADLPRQTKTRGRGRPRHTKLGRRYALAASSEPRGRKYCVPLMGAEILRRSSWRSSLRSTKSISEVFTMSRSDEV